MNPEMLTASYLPTLIRYVLAAVGIAGVMMLLYFVLTRFGVRTEVATGITLITPWLLGFLIWTAFPIVS